LESRQKKAKGQADKLDEGRVMLKANHKRNGTGAVLTGFIVRREAANTREKRGSACRPLRAR